ncbi:hypothetical protein A0128_03205 [Leptospira tipperaryensis]|uniref:Uncharacterized protein n=1 Tax=Leptospira tipperaryensis TaxID=2564040 RepID=A0A1D7UTR0_9LEPT|nr:hypothetical protein A0128_03205 [Leptospira tipperaryensis]
MQSESFGPTNFAAFKKFLKKNFRWSGPERITFPSFLNSSFELGFESDFRMLRSYFLVQDIQNSRPTCLLLKITLSRKTSTARGIGFER